MEQKTSYGAESIQVLNDLAKARKLYNFKDLRSKVKKRGDLNKMTVKN